MRLQLQASDPFVIARDLQYCHFVNMVPSELLTKCQFSSYAIESYDYYKKKTASLYKLAVSCISFGPLSACQ